MAHWTCGFELGDTASYVTLGWTGGVDQITSTAGEVHDGWGSRGGTYAFKMLDSGMYSPVFGVGGRYIHWWFKYGQAQTQFYIYRNGGAAADVVFYGTGYGRVGGGAMNEYFAYNTNVAHWIAWEIDAKNSGGTMTLYIDGVQVASFTGDTTSNANDGFDQIRLAGNTGNRSLWDDIIITTEEEGMLEGEWFSPPMPCSGNDLIQSDSGTYDNIEDIPPNSSYNEFTSVGAGKTDRYDTTAIGFTPEDIHCITVFNQGARDGTVTQAQIVCGSDSQGGGVQVKEGTINGLGSAGVVVGWQETFTTDPDTSSAIVAVDTTNDTFSIAGDKTSSLQDGGMIEVTGSTGNDGMWVIESSVFSTPNTVITVTGDVTDSTADGNLTWHWTGTASTMVAGVKFS